MKSTWLAAGLAVAAVAAQAGSISAGREIRYPQSYDRAKVTVQNGKVVVVPPTPTSFTTRKTGSNLRAQFVGISRASGKRVGNTPVYELQFHDGRRALAATGRVTVIDGVKHLAMGWQGRAYCLKNLKTRKILRFARPAPAPAASRPR
jgi:hypothetical protein